MLVHKETSILKIQIKKTAIKVKLGSFDIGGFFDTYFYPQNIKLD